MTTADAKTGAHPGDDGRSPPGCRGAAQNDLADAELDQVCGGVRRQSGRLYYRDSDPDSQAHGTTSGGDVSSWPGASGS